jgi:hypothetical protein
MTDTIPDLHGQIMNIHSRDDDDLNAEYSDRRIAYKSGHRDARHAAAELAVDADQRIEALSAQVEALRADAERLDWLDTQGELGGYPGDAMPSWKTWQVQFPASHVRFAIDREREREAQARAALQGDSK